jgi:multidrug transporter EmrE-like cation transporter
MSGINWRTLQYGLTFGAIDSIALPIIKGVSTGWNGWLIVIPMFLYGMSPLIFLKALEKETLTIMNLVWDMTSDLIVTLIGIFVFAEKLSPLKLLGVALSFVSLFLMTYEGDGWNDYLTRNYQEAVTTVRSVLGYQ